MPISNLNMLHLIILSNRYNSVIKSLEVKLLKFFLQYAHPIFRFQ